MKKTGQKGHESVVKAKFNFDKFSFICNMKNPLKNTKLRKTIKNHQKSVIISYGWHNKVHCTVSMIVCSPLTVRVPSLEFKTVWNGNVGPIQIGHRIANYVEYIVE